MAVYGSLDSASPTADRQLRTLKAWATQIYRAENRDNDRAAGFTPIYHGERHIGSDDEERVS